MKQCRFQKFSSLICLEFVLIFSWFFLLSQKIEFEYIWILTNETILFLKKFFTNLLKICSSLFTIFPAFFYFLKNSILNIFEL
jgi:hypothetical protein